jgi:hypothetical protein
MIKERSYILEVFCQRKQTWFTRDIISPDFLFCVSGGGGIESTQHLFLLCNTFGSLWTLVCDNFSVDSWVSN